MKKLRQDWLTQGILDFEYKKYLLLAYLQHVSRNYGEQKIYPFLSDLMMHYHNLVKVKQNKSLVKEQFPKNLKQVDVENFKLQYEELISDDRYLAEVEKILDYAIPRMKECMDDGKALFDFVQEKLRVEPIGLLPLNKDFGYIFIKQAEESYTKVYNYELSFYEAANERYRSIKTKYLDTYEKSITNTFESLKLELIKTERSMPNPATFLVQSKMKFPFAETLLPVTKRIFIKYLSTLN